MKGPAEFLKYKKEKVVVFKNPNLKAFKNEFIIAQYSDDLSRITDSYYICIEQQVNTIDNSKRVVLINFLYLLDAKKKIQDWEYTCVKDVVKTAGMSFNSYYDTQDIKQALRYLIENPLLISTYAPVDANNVSVHYFCQIDLQKDVARLEELKEGGEMARYLSDLHFYFTTADSLDYKNLAQSLEMLDIGEDKAFLHKNVPHAVSVKEEKGKFKI